MCYNILGNIQILLLKDKKKRRRPFILSEGAMQRQTGELFQFNSIQFKKIVRVMPKPISKR